MIHNIIQIPRVDLIKTPVCVLTVTYGKRAHLLLQVLNVLYQHSAAIKKIVVVNNGSEESNSEIIKSQEDPRLYVIHLPKNKGSATGFAVAMKAATESKCDLIWLLDDDNMPKKEALNNLLNFYILLGSDPRNVLSSSRIHRYGKKLPECFITKNSFLGFHIRNFFREFLHNNFFPSDKVKFKQYRNASYSYGVNPLLAIDVAPYGGLLFHNSWIKKIGFPNTEFFTYSDDTEWTYRITRNGGRIYLCKHSVIEDIEVSWSVRIEKKKPWVSADADSMRLFYSMRNRVFFENRIATNKIIYLINMFIRLGVLLVNGIIHEKRKLRVFHNLRILCKAILDGWTGKLGIQDSISRNRL